MNDPKMPFDELQQRINQAKGKDKENEGSAPGPVDVSQAARFVVELASGLVVGGACGYFIDRWLSTFPVFFIICFFLGAAAGFRNLMRDAEKSESESKE